MTILGPPNTTFPPLLVSVCLTLTTPFFTSKSRHLSAKNFSLCHTGVDGEGVEGFEAIFPDCLDQLVLSPWGVWLSNQQLSSGWSIYRSSPPCARSTRQGWGRARPVCLRGPLVPLPQHRPEVCFEQRFGTDAELFLAEAGEGFPDRTGLLDKLALELLE